MSHGVLAGVGLGALVGHSGLGRRLAESLGWADGQGVMLAVLYLFSVAFGLGIVWLTRAARLSSDAATGVLFSLVTAAGLVLYSMAPKTMTSLSGLFYGSPLFVDGLDLAVLAGLALASALFMAWANNRLALIDLDARLARAHGVNTAAYEYAYAALLALVVAASARLAGILLVTALLILPAATARGFSRGAGAQFWWAQIVAGAAGLAGVFVAGRGWVDAPLGACVVLCAGALFAVSAGWTILRRGDG